MVKKQRFRIKIIENEYKTPEKCGSIGQCYMGVGVTYNVWDGKCSEILIAKRSDYHGKIPN